MKLGIVIVSYRSDDLTVRFVKEELSRVRMPYTLVVVDNGATEEEAAALQLRIPEAYVMAAENGGFARGNNLGAAWLSEHGGVDQILFTNNDIHLCSDDVVERLSGKLAANPEIGAIGPEVVGTDGKRQSPEPYIGIWDRFVWMYVSTLFLSREKKEKRFRLDYPEKAQEGFHYKLMGSFLLVDAEAFFSAGMFDGNTFLYAEEPILSERFSAIGRRMYFYPAVRVVHEHGTTIRRSVRRRDADLLQWRSMAYYYRRYRGVSRFSIAVSGLFYRMISLF